MKLKLKKDNIMVKPWITDNVVKGILLPESATKKKNIGIVIEISSEIDNIKIGDKVVFDDTPFDNIVIENEKYYFLKEENIIAIVED